MHSEKSDFVSLNALFINHTITEILWQALFEQLKIHQEIKLTNTFIVMELIRWREAGTGNKYINDILCKKVRSNMKNKVNISG